MNTQDIRRQSVSGNHAFRLPRDVARLEGPLELHDGHVIHVRVIRPHDDERLREFHRRLSPDAIMFRFFHMLPELPAPDAEHFTHVDYVNRMALLATTGSAAPEEILGVVRYDRTEDTTGGGGFRRGGRLAGAWHRDRAAASSGGLCPHERHSDLCRDHHGQQRAHDRGAAQ